MGFSASRLGIVLLASTICVGSLDCSSGSGGGGGGSNAGDDGALGRPPIEGDVAALTCDPVIGCGEGFTCVNGQCREEPSFAMMNACFLTSRRSVQTEQDGIDGSAAAQATPREPSDPIVLPDDIDQDPAEGDSMTDFAFEVGAELIAVAFFLEGESVTGETELTPEGELTISFIAPAEISGGSFATAVVEIAGIPVLRRTLFVDQPNQEVLTHVALSELAISVLLEQTVVMPDLRVSSDGALLIGFTIAGEVESDDVVLVAAVAECTGGVIAESHVRLVDDVGMATPG